MKPNDNSEIFLDSLVKSIQTHLTTVGGLYITTATYSPSPLPLPAIKTWTGYTIPPTSGSPAPRNQQELEEAKNNYDKLDWSKIPLDKNDPDVQEIINPDIGKIDEKIKNEERESGTKLDDLGKAGATQMDNVKAEIIDNALIEQGIVQVDNTDTNLQSGYKNLDELLKIAGSWAPKLSKNPRVNYGNLKSGYIKGVHGLCPQGTQSVVVALTGVAGLGRISGNADWFSFANPSTGGGRSSFAIPIGGKTYYNDKVKVGKDFITDKSKWQVGDIIVNGYVDGKPYGHIQVWTGWKWVSDFSQNAVQQRKVDFNTIALWRLNENGKQAVQSQKKA